MKKTFAIILALLFIIAAYIPAAAEPDTTPATTGGAQLVLTAYDATGTPVPVPKGNSGDSISMRIPLLCDGGAVHDIRIAPVLSTSENDFPFEIDRLDYTLSHADRVEERGIIEFKYDFTLRKKVTAGMKEVRFAVVYLDDNNVEKSTNVTVYVNVVKGYVETTPNIINPGISTPKLMLESYSISLEKVYAGETFTISFTLKNTSISEAVENIQVKLSDPSNVVIPASNSSNSVYIESIGRGSSKTATLSFQTSPDAEAAKYVMNLDMSYEGAISKQSYTPASESITVPVLQRLRVKIDEPIIYDEATEGSVVNVSLSVYNMGKTPLYNCMLAIEGEGLSLAESYFGGTLAAGATLRPDLEVLTGTSGYIQGNILLTYEDAYGEATTEHIPFNISVKAAPKADDPDIGADVPIGEPQNDPATPWWVWAIIIFAVIVIAIIAINVIKRRKRRDEDFDQ